ncbi:MAG TPA: ribonuclease P protein component [Chitinophagaceae bacterium]|nr:ribonuclease P protein component [Chitinophagaceae bacterium]
MSKPFSYNKKEKLKSRKLLEQLFEGGRSFTAFPLKVFYITPGTKLDFYIKAGVGVSGRNFKKAVQRNHIKRLLREAYRTEKAILHQFLQEKDMQAAIFILYVDKALPVYSNIKAKMPLVLKRLINELNEIAVKNN